MGHVAKGLGDARVIWAKRAIRGLRVPRVISLSLQGLLLTKRCAMYVFRLFLRLGNLA